MRFLKSFKKESFVEIKDLCKMCDIDLCKRLYDYFLDFDFNDRIGIQTWLSNGNENIHNILNVEDSGEIDNSACHHFRGDIENSYVSYRVFIELRNFKKISDIYQELIDSIKRTESHERLKFIYLEVRNYNWDKYQKSWLNFNNINNIKNFKEDILMIGMNFKKL